ncbi:NOL1/NOP2/sun family RNA methylase [Nitzschia inconspicua]|uniref:NOL1/NOP2/sun family RNA methylase n=1 Tax=Nitzschia inconspicua TaxID=303405 RepID=A0A9K3LKV3_9STRA|nr:NOL1/NOP2/sun family RNA methylase [Nitzschia inconspicua]
MGRSWRRRNKNRHKNKNAEENGEDSRRKKKTPSNGNNPYTMVEYGNFRMESFYAYQGIHDFAVEKEVDDDGNVVSYKFVSCTSAEQKEQERQRWMEAMKGTLPASFRIGSDVDVHLRQRLEHELNEMVGQKMEIEIEPRGGDFGNRESKAEIKLIAPAQKIQFVPHSYQLSLDRQTIRRNPKLESFHNWLKVQTEAGFITRQETVSMIPPVVLNPEPHHMILDMAAAPGSKTSQLLEIVNFPSKAGDHEPTGFVVANDSDHKRAYMLTHQIRRINSPAIFVTSCDARHFPILKESQDGEAGTVSEGIFDRVLADVPCSGDGTSRKNPGVWKSWSALNGYSLHSLQLAIALRGAQCTKVGGYLCYSTCSMNPIENEAVVAALLRASEGSLELVERRSELPGLVARPGLSTWKNLAHERSNRQIKDNNKKNSAKMQARRKEWEQKEMTDCQDNMTGVESSLARNAQDDIELENHEDFISIRTKFEPKSLEDMEELKRMVESSGMIEYKTFDDVPSKMRKRVVASCFPPTPEEVSSFHLDRCMRIMPQDMNTGGFFVALLKKVAPFNAKARARFIALQEQLEAVEDDGEEEGEPDLKRVKLDSESKSIEAGEDGKEAGAAGIDMVHGYLKRDFLIEKDGTKSTTVGKDDFVPVSDDIFIPLKEYYGIDEESFKEGQFATRAASDKKVLYFLTKAIKKQLIDRKFQEKVTVIASGLKAFVRNSKDCEATYRVSQEGIHLVAPHMSKRKIVAGIDDFETCLKSGTVEIKNFTEEFQKQVRALSMGSFVVSLQGYEDDYIKKLVLVMWRCRSDAVKFLVTQAEVDGMRSKMRAIKETSAGSIASGGDASI